MFGKRKIQEGDPYLVVKVLSQERDLYKFMQRTEDIKADESIELTAQDLFRQYKGGDMVLVERPYLTMLTEYPGQTAKYASESYNQAVSDRFKELKETI